MPCCADAAAASLSAAALRRCGCAQNGMTPLHWAAFKGKVACVALLVERGANKDAKNDVRCAAPSPAAAAVRCTGTAASAQRCAHKLGSSRTGSANVDSIGLHPRCQGSPWALVPMPQPCARAPYDATACRTAR
jgi:ankyrin repeat protein